jgi:hypothetical protein
VGGVTVDDSDNILVSQAYDLLRIDTHAGTISSVATGEWPSLHGSGNDVDGLPAIRANLGLVGPVAVTGRGEILVVDQGNDRIRKISPRVGPSMASNEPARLFDTRPGEPNGSAIVPKQRLAGATELRVHVAGIGSIPSSGVGAVALNVTVTQPTGDGFVTVYPCGSRPLASNLNFTAGQTIPNTVIAPVNSDGDICFYSNTPTHLLADISGWFPTFNGLTALVPVRLFDTRPSEPNGQVIVPKQRVGGATELRVHIPPIVGAPAGGIGAAVLNVTVTEPAGSGFVTVYPCGSRPLASNLNFTVGQTIPNTVIAPVNSDGDICFYSNTPTHLLADIVGWFATSAT